MRSIFAGSRRLCTGIAGLALGLAMLSPAAAFEIESMSDGQREAFREEVRAYLLEHPEVLIEVFDRLEARQAEAEAADDQSLIRTNARELFNDDHSWVGGNPEGDVTLVEFVDYACGFCKRAHPEVTELLERDDQLRLVIKEFPILGPESERASRFAIAVLQSTGPDAYEAVMDNLLRLSGPPNAAARARIADDLGLDLPAIKARMDSTSVSQVIDRNRALAMRLRINGTPTFVTESEMVRGYLPVDGMQNVVDATRAAN